MGASNRQAVVAMSPPHDRTGISLYWQFNHLLFFNSTAFSKLFPQLELESVHLAGGHHEVAEPGVEEQQRAKRTHGGGEDYEDGADRGDDAYHEDDADQGDDADGKELFLEIKIARQENPHR